MHIHIDEMEILFSSMKFRIKIQTITNTRYIINWNNNYRNIWTTMTQKLEKYNKV